MWKWWRNKKKRRKNAETVIQNTHSFKKNNNKFVKWKFERFLFFFCKLIEMGCVNVPNNVQCFRYASTFYWCVMFGNSWTRWFIIHGNQFYCYTQKQNWCSHVQQDSGWPCPHNPLSVMSVLCTCSWNTQNTHNSKPLCSSLCFFF